jgi:hypothetical protein
MASVAFRDDSAKVLPATTATMTSVALDLVDDAIHEDSAKVDLVQARAVSSIALFFFLQAAYTAVHRRILKRIYSGGCPREYGIRCPTGVLFHFSRFWFSAWLFPAGWVETVEVVCVCVGRFGKAPARR